MITFTGLSSVSGRTLFTNRGPIVKKPTALLTGTDLQVVSATEVVIPSGSFTSTNVGMSLNISGSAGGRNDGTFFIAGVLGPTKLSLESVSLSPVDVSSTTNDVVALANDIRRAYNAHVISPGIHQVFDLSDLVTAQIAVDLASANILLNQIKQKFNTHIVTLAGIHLVADSADTVVVPDATSLVSAVLLANSIRRAYEAHRLNAQAHLAQDFIDRVVPSEVSATVGTFPGPLTGPFSWTLYDPRIGQIADEPDDVIVRVNGSPVGVDAVFGLLGAIVLTDVPGPTDTVAVDYSWLNNPPTQIQRLNSPEFNLNQGGSRGYAGYPAHRYRARSSLIIPGQPNEVKSPVSPLRVGWKYKALERQYSACLNDPNTLLLNVPTNRLAFQGIQAVVQESVVRYDPTSLPQNATDPWTLEGDGSGLALAPGGFELSITHSGSAFGTTQLPPFFSHVIDLGYPSIVSAAFRTRIDSFIPDGAFTGVCFGLSDGLHAAIIGLLQTDAINLSSAIVLVNALKAAFNNHIILQGVHVQPDPSDAVTIVDATDLPSLIILSNALLFLYNTHLNNTSVHLAVDSADLLVSPQATTLAGALLILNEMRVKFDAHLVSPVHVNPDTVDSVPQVKQVGILTNRGFPEDQASWNCTAVDWTQYVTYRIFRDSNGDMSLFFSGVSSPVATAMASEIPPVAVLDGKFDELQQVFFGTIGKLSSSVSKWQFIRVDVQPLDSNQVGLNKSVDYEPTHIPEADPTAPWIVLGQGGYERLNNVLGLILDSTASAPDSVISSDALGLSSGPYRGFLRLEPTLTSRATTSLEFTGKIGYYTFSVDNVASGIFIDDDQFAVHLTFIQANPTPATITGQSTEPFDMVTDDSVLISVDNGPIFTVSFGSGSETASDIVTGFTNAAVPGLTASAVSGSVKLQTTTIGATSKITLIGGSALVKLGFVPGTTFGTDSSPEPKASWFGENRPDLDTPSWVSAGSQSGVMMGRTLRIADASTTDFLTFSLLDPLVTTQVFNPSVDWKVDFRLSAVSFVPGDAVNGLFFCGALLNVDEGTLGFNVEMQLCVDASGNPFVHVLTFNKTTGAMVSVASYPFIWNDLNPHSFNLFTSKQSGLMIVLADGVALGTFSLSSLLPGVIGPSITFGSGGNATANADLRAPFSVFDWNSVAIFRDSRISDLSAPSNRFIGLYRGGDPSLLSSYYLAQVDWTNLHTYKIVRDPDSNVSVYLDGAFTPSISINYDVLALPPVSSSFLQTVTNSRPAVAFGSFNPKEIDRTIWQSVKYSVGKITQTNGLVPPSQELNHGNAVVSPEHLMTDVPHSHFGFRVYSGGTPTDDFMSNPMVPAFTQLGEGTPPVPMSQDLDSQGGLQQTFVPVDSVSSLDFVNQRGFLSDFEDDTVDVSPAPAVEQSSALASLIVLVNELVIKYDSHRVYMNGLISIHPTNDTINVAGPADAVDLPSAISRLNILSSAYTAHLSQASVHIHNDTVNILISPACTDLPTAIVLADEIRAKFSIHQSQGDFHPLDDTVNGLFTSLPPGFPAPTLDYTIITLNDLIGLFNAHLLQPSVHVHNDMDNTVSVGATDLATALVAVNDLSAAYNNHVSNTPGPYHSTPDSSFVYSGPSATDLNSLMIKVDRLMGLFNLHISHGPPIHLHVDAINVDLDIGPTLSLLNLINTFSTLLVQHRTHTVVGSSILIFHLQERESSLSPLLGRYNYSSFALNPNSIDFASVFANVNQIRQDYNTHILDNTHQVSDIEFASVVPNATDITSAGILLIDLIEELAQHGVGRSWHDQVTFVGFTPIASSAVTDPLVSAIATANALQPVLNAHFLRLKSHIKADSQDLVLSQPAVDLPSLIILVNEMKLRMNTHTPSQVYHIGLDSSDSITAPDATDLQSAGVLINAIITAYEAHRVRPGIHGSSVFVRLDPPSGILYQGMKFYTSESGVTGLVAPFSDDDPLSFGGFQTQLDQAMEYPAGMTPEHTVLVGLKAEPFSLQDGDTLSVSIDWAAPITVTFSSSDTTAANIVSRINGTAGIPSGFASLNGDGRVRLTSQTATVSSNVQVSGGAAVQKLGFDEAQPSKWSLMAGNPSAVTIQMLTSGGTDFLRFNTTATDAVYRMNTGLPDVTSMDFDATFALRVSASPVTEGDTGVYVGISGITGPGFTVALGFDVQAGSNYIRLVDLNTGKDVFRRLFNWADGAFHTYKISKVTKTNSLQISILS